jgi:muramidase (phage lysozyme)
MDRLNQLWQNPNVKAFARAVRFCEGTFDDEGYHRMFGGKLFDSFTDHPRSPQTYTLRKGGKLTSTAAGAYQFLSRTWDGLVKQHKFIDFSPSNQDLGFVALVDGRKALADLVRGDLRTVVRKCALEWASLPGSPYGQPVKSFEEVQRVYLESGGSLGATLTNPTPTTIVAQPLKPTESPMLPALLPMVKVGLLEVIPRLIKHFGSGSEVSERNIKAVEMVAEIAKASTGTKNEQELLEVLKTNPEAVAQVKEAVEVNWFRLEELGGGVEAAAKRDLAVLNATEGFKDLFRSPSFVIGAFGLLPLVYIIVLSLVGVIGKAEWSMEVRASIAGLIVGTIVGGLVGYYYGQTTSRNRTSNP